MSRQPYPVTCPECGKEWTHTDESGWVIVCPDCALKALQEECKAQKELEADERMERLAEGDGCCESVAVVAAGCGAIVWGLMKAAGWC